MIQLNSPSWISSAGSQKRRKKRRFCCVNSANVVYSNLEKFVTQNKSCCLLSRERFNSQNIFLFLLLNPEENQVLKVILLLIILLSSLHIGLVVTLKKKQQKNPKRITPQFRFQYFMLPSDLWFQGNYVTGPGFAMWSQYIRRRELETCRDLSFYWNCYVLGTPKTIQCSAKRRTKICKNSVQLFWWLCSVSATFSTAVGTESKSCFHWVGIACLWRRLGVVAEKRHFL